MNQVIARIKGKRGDNQFQKLISNTNAFNPFEIDEAVPYSPDTLLESGQWYMIEHFSSEEYCPGFLSGVWDSTKFEQTTIDFEKIDYIVSYQDGNDFYFQRAGKRNLLKNRNFFEKFGDDVKQRKPDNILMLNEYPDALYKKEEDTLYFQKLETITPIFKGIDVLYRESTQEEVDIFLDSPFITIIEGFDGSKVGKPNRHRLTAVKTILDKMTEHEKTEVFDYTNEYYPDLKYNNGQFEINSDESLKNLFYGIEQRFYTTAVTNEKRIANSIIPMK